MTEAGIPKVMTYSVPTEAIAKGLQKQEVYYKPMTGGTYSPGEIVRFAIPTRGYLNTGQTYLRFTVTFADTLVNGAGHASLCGLDTSGYCLISDVKIFGPDQVLLNHFREFGSYMNMMIRQTVPADSTLNALIGRTKNERIFGDSCDGHVFHGTAAPAPAAQGNNAAAFGIGGGVATERVWNLVGQDGRTVQFCLPFNVGVFGTGKMLPLEMLKGDIIVEVTLERRTANRQIIPHWLTYINRGADAALWDPSWALHRADDTTINYTVKDFEICSEIILMDPGFGAMIRQAVGASGLLTMAGTDVQHFAGTLQQGATEQRVNLPVRARSVKSLYAFIRIPNERLSGGHHCNLRAYQLDMNGTRIPARPIELGVDTYANMAQALGILNTYSVTSVGRWPHGPSFAREALEGADAGFSYKDGLAQRIGDVIGPTNCVLAYNLEAFPQSSEVMHSGLDTQTVPVQTSLILSFKDGGPRAFGADQANASVQCFALCDAVYSLDASGVLRVSY